MKALRLELAESRALGLTKRDVVKLKCYDHFYSRVVNAQINKEAREVLDAIIQDYIYTLGRETK